VGSYGDLDPACIRVLSEIVAGGDGDVVVSSTWRHGKTVAELQDMLRLCLLRVDGAGFCPDDPATRAQVAVFLVRAFGF
jgi:hypothetical protein